MTLAEEKEALKRKIKELVESDWKDYYGSSDSLNADIEKFGVLNFSREILHLGNSKGICSYIEAREQFLKKVLESEEYYNSQIQIRTHKSHIFNKL